MSTTEQIRQRYLHKIGFSLPQKPPPPSSETMNNASQISCLGEVIPSYEPLKICLDDDSSFEGDDFDDDFYFGDEDFPTPMEIDASIRNLHNDNPRKVWYKNETTLNEDTSSQIHQNKPEGPKFVETTNIVSENGSINSSSDVASSPPSIITSFHFSTGNLTNISNVTNDSSLDTRSTKRARSRRRVSLHNNVALIPIPGREEYSDRLRQCLWSSTSEIYENAVRNSIEFAAEGWNWRAVVEDENMILCDSGALVHPIHLQNLLQVHTSQTNQNSQQKEQNISSTTRHI